ncbi:MAG: hypothetical protein WC529_06725 [Candidatus Margulisiibacteriota bacterium]
MAGKIVSLPLDEYAEKGLYLLFPDATRLDITASRVKAATKEYWADETKIPQEVRKTVDFQRCDFCPRLKDGGICDAIRPVLPFLDALDKYVSFDKVTAVYKGWRPDLWRFSDTNMQNALVYLSTLSLIHYCQVAVQYRKYFYGVNPLMNATQSSARIYLNIYWEKNGDCGKVNALLADFKAVLSVTAQNQVKRLSLISKNDAFINAIIKTQLITEFLAQDYDDVLANSFKTIEQKNREEEKY